MKRRNAIASGCIKADGLATDIGHARALARAGDDDAAKRAYVELLRNDPADLAALVELGTLAASSHHLAAARTTFEQAVRFHPDDPVARTGLADRLLDDGDSAQARAHYEAALAADPDHPEAHAGLARLLADLGEHDAAEPHWQRGFAGRSIVRRRFRGTAPGVNLLLLASARGGNIPTRHWIDERHFAVTALYADFHDPTAALPPHDLLVNVIGDADFCPDALAGAARIANRSRAPVVNPPALVSATGRAAVAERLAGIPGLVVPRIRTVARAGLPALAPELPLLLRAPGFHTGRHFRLIDDAASLAVASDTLPGETLLAIQHLDARGPDGLARKYRVMFIGGTAYPLHLAISSDWKVHYVTSAMAAAAAFRREEQRFLDDMPACLGPRAMAALDAVCRHLGLDYAGIDFALAPDGSVLLFEANATMVVNPPAPDPIWDYRRPAADAVLRAADRMLRERAAA